MNKEDEILALLQEIRAFQQEAYNEWKAEMAKSEQIRQKLIADSEMRMNELLRNILGLHFNPLGGQKTHSPPDKRNCYEAREWLKINNNPSPLASNRFSDKEEAMQFIETLYQAGAKEVSVLNPVNNLDRIKDEGGPYADSLVVTLPKEKGKRKTLFKINNNEAAKEGFDSISDTGQNELDFWWD